MLNEVNIQWEISGDLLICLFDFSSFTDNFSDILLLVLTKNILLTYLQLVSSLPIPSITYVPRFVISIYKFWTLL